MGNYYVYVYLDTRKFGVYKYGDIEFEYEPFYVGKGQKDRYRQHLCDAYSKLDEKDTSVNVIKCRKIRKIKKETGNDPIIKIVKNFEFEREALIHEEFLIKKIGKIIDNSGPLSNMTDYNNWQIGKDHPCYIEVSDDTVKKIINMYSNGTYIAHIGKELGIGEGKVKKILLENNIALRPRKPANFISISVEIEENIIFDYKNNLSIRDISIKYSLPFNKVRIIIKDNNLTRNNGFVRTEHHLQNQLKSRKGKYLGKKNKSYKHLSEGEIDDIIRLFCVEKKSILFIARTLGYSTNKITKELVDLHLFSVKSRR